MFLYCLCPCNDVTISHKNPTNTQVYYVSLQHVEPSKRHLVGTTNTLQHQGKQKQNFTSSNPFDIAGGKEAEGIMCFVIPVVFYNNYVWVCILSDTSNGGREYA